MKIYKPPPLSRLALRVAQLLPRRVFFAAWIGALDELTRSDGEWLRSVEIHERDVNGNLNCVVYCDVVEFIAIETLRRRIWRDELHATVEDK